jgi:flagellum-specific peptidoglycan hydrolase FlgJ
VASDTTEFVDGVERGERGRFRAYGSVAENVGDYVRVLRDNPRYAAALGTGSDVRAFADALQRGGYATDPDYANKLVTVAGQLESQPGGRLRLAADVSSFKSAADEPIPMARLNNG